MTALDDFYQSSFDQQSSVFPKWFAKLQQHAFENYENQGLPSRKTEQWKYASLETLKNTDYQCGEISISKEKNIKSIEIHDGNIVIPQSLPKGLTILPLSQAMKTFENDFSEIFPVNKNSKNVGCFENLNMALLTEGLFIRVDKDTHINTAIAININTTESQLSQHLHHVMILEEGAKASLVEVFNGSDNLTYFNNHVLQCIVKSNAEIEYVKVIEESARAFHIGKTNLFVAKDARATCHSFALSGSMIRSDINADLCAPGADIKLNGLYLTSGKQNVAHYTRVNHLTPHASSDELYKGILGGSSKGTFNGAVFVAKDAQKTNASQQNKNLLLSSKAEINTKPQLEIFADDVKCAHGATIGQLDDVALFYLQSRGIPKQAAASLLVHAFAGDLIEKLSAKRFSELKQHLLSHLENFLRLTYDE